MSKLNTACHFPSKMSCDLLVLLGLCVVKGAGVLKFVLQLSHSLIRVTESSNIAPHGKELSEDLKRHIVALHEDGQGYKKIANTLKRSCNTVAKITQRVKRAGSTQNRPRVGRLKKLSARAERHIQMPSLKDRLRSAVTIAAEIEEVGVSLLVHRPYAALYIKLVCMAVTPGGSLFWKRYTRKPSHSLLKTCQQSTLITGTMSYGLMRWRLICLVPMASSICGGDQVRSNKISVSCLQSSMLVGMLWTGATWVLQMLKSYISLRETWTPTCTVKYYSRALSPPHSRNLDDHCFTEEAEGKGDQLTKHVSRLELTRTSLGDPQIEGGDVQSLKYPPAPRRRPGWVKEHSSGYMWSSDKVHAQESKGSAG